MRRHSGGRDTADAAPATNTSSAFAVYQAAHAFTRAYKPLLEGLGLTYPQYLAMLALWERDGQAVKDLGHRWVSTAEPCRRC